MRIVINGVTGFVGSNLIFEFIKQNLNNLDDLEMILLGRSKSYISFKDRVLDIFRKDGISYIALDSSQIKKVEDYLRFKVHYIEIELTKENIGITNEGFKILKFSPIDFFFHIAASVDMQLSHKAERKARKINTEGTKNVLSLLRSLAVKELVFVGTAYCCGKSTGNIKPDYINRDQDFNNPYELSKLEAEIAVRNFQKETQIKCRYFRPSIICGRLIEKPYGYIKKFDTFYQILTFLLAMKMEYLKEGEDKYKKMVNIDVRIFFNPNASLNIVPIDYVVKMMYQACIQNDAGESYHLVNDNTVYVKDMIGAMLKILNIEGTRLVQEMPLDLNFQEDLYYKTLGKIATKYLTKETTLFNKSNLKELADKINLKCPEINETNFKHLLEYGKENDFGLNDYFWL